MTRQMADDEVLRVFDEARMHMEGRLNSAGAREITDARLAEARTAVAALQAERDALREKVARDHQWITDLLAENKAATERAERAESALEALRGQVAELMKFREGGLPTKGWLRDNDQSRRALHELNALLAMKNSGEF